MSASWLDRAVGFENFPDGDWLEQRILDTPILDPKNIIGIDPATGGAVFVGKPGSPLGQLITQGAVNTAAGLMYNASIDQNGRVQILDNLEKQIENKIIQALQGNRFRSNGT